MSEGLGTGRIVRRCLSQSMAVRRTSSTPTRLEPSKLARQQRSRWSRNLPADKGRRMRTGEEVAKKIFGVRPSVPSVSPNAALCRSVPPSSAF